MEFDFGLNQSQILEKVFAGSGLNWAEKFNFNYPPRECLFCIVKNKEKRKWLNTTNPFANAMLLYSILK
ncbi:hypothetical protein D1003_05750 [Riemerella anatipestifer]|nr:hypothetical protein [Riemerella anatipestifer]